MISIAMTAHNAAGYLIEQLDSIRMQSRPADEVIIVDDASDDCTLRLIEDYIETYQLKGWRAESSEINRGYIQSFRQAISLCQGDWIFLCDHDDIWKPDKIELMLDAVWKTEHPLALFSSFERMDSQSEPLPDSTAAHRANQGLIRRPVFNRIEPVVFDDLQVYNTSQGCTMMISSKLAKQYLSCRKLNHLPHDYALNLIASFSGSLYFLDEPLVRYRIHEHNTLGLSREQNWKKRVDNAKEQVLQKQEELLLARKFGTELQQKKALKVLNFFRRRSQALDRRSVMKLVLLLPESLSFPTMALTIAQDAKTVMMQKRKTK